MKPDPRSYGAVFAALGLDASSCLFVDDQTKNIAGAQAVGMPTVWFDVTTPAKA